MERNSFKWFIFLKHIFKLHPIKVFYNIFFRNLKVVQLIWKQCKIATWIIIISKIMNLVENFWNLSVPIFLKKRNITIDLDVTHLISIQHLFKKWNFALRLSRFRVLGFILRTDQSILCGGSVFPWPGNYFPSFRQGEGGASLESSAGDALRWGRKGGRGIRRKSRQATRGSLKLSIRNIWWHKMYQWFDRGVA